MKKIILTLLVVALSTLAHAQFTFQNPSFEGTPQPHVVPSPWTMCFNGGTPDTQPGEWGINQPPAEGNSYISFLLSGEGSNSYQEGASQQLSGCMTAGVEYTFSLNVAWSPIYDTAEPQDCYGSVAIYGGSNTCDKGELLWTSGALTTAGWQTVTVTFTPTQNWCYVSFTPYFISPCSGYINGMVDNISPIVPTNPGLQITGPSDNSTIACDFTLTGTTDSIPSSVTLFGNFTGSPLTATVTGQNWQSAIDYPNNIVGPQTIIAVGVFPPNNDVKTDTLHINVVHFTADFTTDTVCSGNQTHFTNLSTIDNPGNISGYQWNFEPGQTSINQSPTYSFNQGGTYDVELIITTNPGCTDTVTKQVVVLPGANANYNYTSGCLGEAVIFSDSSFAQSGSINQWGWNFGDNTPTSNAENPTHNYNTAGTYTVQLIVSTTLGCTDTLTQSVFIDPVPVANFSAVPTTGCMPLAVSFSDLSVGSIASWLWNFGNGATSTLPNPANIYNAPGSYDITLIVGTIGNCFDTIVQPNYITVEACQDLTITDPAANDTTGCQYLITGTTNIPVQSVSLNGDITGAPVEATLIDSTHWQVLVTMNPGQAGTATLYATGNFGNNLLDVDTVTVIVDCPFAIPNVFTPDGDGINDFFVVVVGATTKYEMTVYNRWGRKVFTSQNQTLLWDGKNEGGEDCADGVYYYIFSGEQAGQAIKKNGTITLLRKQ